MRLILTVLCLTLCLGVNSSRADLQFAPSLDQWCKPAKAVSHTLLRWKAPATCQNDCFTWRLSCSSGKQVTLQSAINPNTTEAQWVFKSWAPWSFAVYLAVIFGYGALAIVGAEMLALQLTGNAVLVTYAAYAAWAWYAAVTGNPWGTTAEFDRVLILNGYIYAAVMAVFFILNLPAVRRGFEDLFFRHHAGTMPAVLAAYPAHAEAMRAALTPHLFEFVDPYQTAEHYRRETGKVRAMRERLDAYTALARAMIQHERLRRNHNDNQ